VDGSSGQAVVVQPEPRRIRVQGLTCPGCGVSLVWTLGVVAITIEESLGMLKWGHRQEAELMLVDGEGLDASPAGESGWNVGGGWCGSNRVSSLRGSGVETGVLLSEEIVPLEVFRASRW